MRNQNRSTGPYPRPASVDLPRPAQARFRPAPIAALGLAGLLAIATPTAALAQKTAGEAATLQAGLRAWFAGLFAPALVLPEPPLTVTADGDGFVLSLPITGQTSVGGKAPDAKDNAITANLRPLSGGRWSLDDLHLPAKGALTVDATDVAPATAVTYSIAEQSARAVVDPTLQTRSSASIELRDGVLATLADGEKQIQRFERYVIQGTLIPGADGRLDIVQDGTLTGWESQIEVGPNENAELEMRRARMGMRLDGVRSDRVGAAFAAIKALVAEARAGNLPDADAKALPPVMRQHARALIESLRDIATRIEGEETLDDFAMTIPGVGEVSLDLFRFGMGGEAPDGKLRAWADIALEGLDVDALPQAMRDYIPARIALRPVISGISTERAFALLLYAVSEKPDEDRLAEDATALLTTGGASIGLETLTLELDTLRIEGSGRMRMLTPKKAGLEARLSATGLDALMADASKKADLRMAMPILAMIRGLGRQEGEKMVWDLAITDDQALVNGVDVMAMPAPADPPPQRRR